MVYTISLHMSNILITPPKTASISGLKTEEGNYFLFLFFFFIWKFFFFMRKFFFFIRKLFFFIRKLFSFFLLGNYFFCKYIMITVQQSGWACGYVVCIICPPPLSVQMNLTLIFQITTKCSAHMAFYGVLHIMITVQ